MKDSIYNDELISAARALVINPDFHTLVTEHIANLKVYTMDAVEQSDVLKAHSEHASIMNFVEYVKMLGEVRKEPHNYD